MEVEVKLEEGRKEPKLVIVVGEETEEIARLVRELSGRALGPVPIRKNGAEQWLHQGEFLRFYAEDKVVLAQTPEGSYETPLRLYELEKQLDRKRFVRISHSEMINLDRVTAVDFSLTGTIRMTLDGAVTAYASRRYVKRIKETLAERRRGACETK